MKDQTPFVRDPAFLDGPRMTQTRQWTVGTPLTPAAGDGGVHALDAHRSRRRRQGRRVRRDDASHRPRARRGVGAGRRRPHRTGTAGTSTWARSRSRSGTHSSPRPSAIRAGGPTETRTWTVDNTLPTAPRTLTTPLASLTTPPLLEHNVYFGEFDMRLDPQDDQPGFVVGELRENGDGWFNYFGFPDQPFGTPFTFSHSGKVVKALTYGNLGTGGLSKAAFEQTPAFGFEPGYGTHLIEHHAIDAAGNIGTPGQFKATVLPGASPACTTTITGKRKNGLTVESGVTCIAGATIDGPVTVEPGCLARRLRRLRAPQGPACGRRRGRACLRSDGEPGLEDHGHGRRDRRGIAVPRQADRRRTARAAATASRSWATRSTTSWSAPATTRASPTSGRRTRRAARRRVSAPSSKELMSPPQRERPRAVAETC